MAEETTNNEPNESRHAPAPESVDQTKSTVTPEQVQAMADAAPQPHAGEEAKEAKEEKEDHSKKKESHSKK